MNSLNRILTILVLCILLPISSAFAQDIESDVSAQNINIMKSDSNAVSRAQAAGWSSILGIGYASTSGMDVSLSGGYKFGSYFGLYADIAFKFGFNDLTSTSKTPILATDIAIVPKFQIGGKVCLFSLGVGLGYYYYKNSKESDSTKYTELTYVTNAFLLKPEIDLDFVFESGFIFGFGLDVPVYLGIRDETIERQYKLHIPNGLEISKSKKYAGDSGKFSYGARCDFQFHLGYKFR